MAADPRPHSAKHPDGGEDMEMEARFREVFSALRPPDTARPVDLPTAVAFVQELYDRLSGKK